MLSVERVALTGSPRKEVDLLPRRGILSFEMDKCGLVHLPVWPWMEIAAHFGTFAVRRDQSSHFCVVLSMAWQLALLLAVRHVSSAYCSIGIWWDELLKR